MKILSARFIAQSLDGVWKASWFDGQRGAYQHGIDTPEADLSCCIDAHVPGEIDTITQLWLGKDMASLSIEDYVYWGGILQGEGLKEYCENFRRRMFSSAAAIFWMYNDCWPTVRSWTIVDYYLRRTPAFHFVRRSMQPLHVVITEDAEKGTITIHGVNDTPSEFAGSLRSGIFRLDGDYLIDGSKDVVLPSNASVVLIPWNKPPPPVIKELGENN